MCFATPSPRTCYRAAPTCACFSRCSAMPISQRPRSTPTSILLGWSSWSMPAIRSQRAVVDAPASPAYPPLPMQNYLDFEKPIAELETRVAELRETANNGEIDIDAEIAKLETKSAKLLRDTYAKLTPWQKTQVSRHPDRPHFKDYLAVTADDFLRLVVDL